MKESRRGGDFKKKFMSIQVNESRINVAMEPMSHYLNNSCYRALWKCPDCGGEYISSIRDMATGNVDCVYCSMKEVLPGVNSFAVLHPDLMNEWNHLDNYLLCDPDQILDNCITPVCWTCPVCAHDYKCSPKQRHYI